MIPNASYAGHATKLQVKYFWNAKILLTMCEQKPIEICIKVYVYRNVEVQLIDSAFYRLSYNMHHTPCTSMLLNSI